MCSKTRHATQLGAIIQARKSKHADIRPYKCSKCGGWHVGHTKRDFLVQKRIDQLLKSPTPEAK